MRARYNREDNMRAPGVYTVPSNLRGTFYGEGLPSLGISHTKAQYIATGEWRAPRRGEYFLSGAIVIAYRAVNDLSMLYWIARPATKVELAERKVAEAQAELTEAHKEAFFNRCDTFYGTTHLTR